MLNESSGAEMRHPNDPTDVRRNLAQSKLILSEDERIGLLESIDRQLAEIDGRTQFSVAEPV